MINQNKTANYLKYAIGEIVLVVIGILIALQVNNWNENRKNIKVANELKHRLIKDVTADIDAMKKRLAFFEIIRNSGVSVEEELIHHNASSIESQWQFLTNVFHISQVWDFSPTTSTFYEIQNSNLLGYIGSSELSNELSQYYVYAPIQLSQISGGTLAYRDYTRSNIPMQIQEYIWTNCYNSEVLGTQLIVECKHPDDGSKIIESIYQSIVSDQNFEKLLTNRLSTIYVRNALYNINIRLAESLINHIKSLK